MSGQITLSSDLLQKAKQDIEGENFNFLVERLITIDRWQKSEAHIAIRQYKNYLYLVKKYSNQYQISPSGDIDKVWHEHILHTEHYVDFCRKIFGIYLHHRPTSKKEKYPAAENTTQALYYKEFNEYMLPARNSFFLSLFKWLNK